MIRSVPAAAPFGIRRVWRGRVAVDVSGPHRTIVDGLDVPAAVGGALRASELLEAYFERPDAARERLIEYGDRLGRGTIFKRLGHLAERAGLADRSLVDECRRRISSGVSQLDPAGPSGGRIVSRGNLRVNSARLAPGGRRAAMIRRRHRYEMNLVGLTSGAVHARMSLTLGQARA